MPTPTRDRFCKNVFQTRPQKRNSTTKAHYYQQQHHHDQPGPIVMTKFTVWAAQPKLKTKTMDDDDDETLPGIRNEGDL